MKCFYCQGQGCNLCKNSGKFLNGKSSSNERYTPSWLVESARQVMGCIDFDPASSKLANTVVKATRFYDWKQDGLKQEWYGNGFCNPPYGRVPGKVAGLQVYFVEKGVDSYLHGYVEQMVFVLNGNAPYRPWFKPLRPFLTCFYDHDVEFWTPEGRVYENAFGSVFVYVGSNNQRFADIFGKYGYIACEYGNQVTRGIWGFSKTLDK